MPAVTEKQNDLQDLLEAAYERRITIWIEFKDGERKEGILNFCRRRDEMAVHYEQIPVEIRFEGDDRSFSSDFIDRAGIV